MKKDKEWLRDEINNLYGDYIQSDWNIAVSACLNLVNQLDEPQKVVVPKWFDEWVKSKIESGRMYDCLDLAHCMIEDYNNGKLADEQEGYVIDNPRDILLALLNGCEVEEEKEKLYWVDLGESNYTYNFINKSGFVRGTYYFDVVRKFGLMTEAEIKAIDKRYWAFAVPVEEVEE